MYGIVIGGGFAIIAGLNDPDEAVIEFASREKAGTLADYPKFYGKDLDALEKDWRKALVKAYEDAEGADALAREYRETSPAQYMSVCRKGKEF